MPYMDGMGNNNWFSRAQLGRKTRVPSSAELQEGSQIHWAPERTAECYVSFGFIAGLINLHRMHGNGIFTIYVPIFS